jgi:hypothetical protein
MSLIRRIRRLQRQLLKFNPEFRFSRVFAASLIALSLLSGSLKAQTFGPPQNNPFGIFSPGNVASPVLADLDADGDIDILCGAYTGTGYNARVAYYQNTGGDCVSLLPPQNNPFGITITPGGVGAFIELADMDADSDLDMFMGSMAYGTLHYYQNTGSSTTPQFASPQANPFGISLSAYVSALTPAAADLDDDGDFDLVLGEYFGNFLFLQNTGTANAPAFAAPVLNPFGLEATPDSLLSTPTFVDLDMDGDMDIISGGYFGDLHYFENIGSATLPFFDLPVTNPFQLTNVGSTCSPDFADMDGDGDPDGFVGDVYGNFTFFENKELINIPPSGGNASVATPKDTDYQFQSSDFPYSDPDGNPFAEIQITQLTSVGSLELSGNPVTLFQVIPASQLGQMTFAPLPGQSGTNYDNFKFKVGDCFAMSGSDYTMTINVTDLSAIRPGAKPTLELFPNPATTELTVVLPSTEQGVILVRDIKGAELKREVISNESSMTIGLENMPTGLYEITLMTASGSWAALFSIR